MAQRLTPIDLSKAEAYNMQKNSAGNWSSRPAFTNIATITQGGESGGQLCVYACTVRSNSGVIYNYVMILKTDKTIQCRIYDVHWNTMSTISTQIKQINPSQPVYHAQSPYNQIVFSSPGWTATLHGHIGSTPTVATKRESINPDTPALPLPAGIVASFGDRIVYCKDNGAYISSPGAECRTITANNAIFVSGTITDAFENPSGDFVIVSTAETRVLSQEGLVSAAFDGKTEKNRNFTGLKLRNATSTKHGSFGLSSHGVINIESGEVIPLAKYRRYRNITAVFGAGLGSDYRSQGRLYPFSQGIIVSLGAGQPIAVINFDHKYISYWSDDQTTGDLVSVLELEDGTPVLAYKNKIFALYGNNTQCTHALAVDIPNPAIDSQVIREVVVQVLADGVQSVSSYIRQDSQTQTPSEAEDSSLVSTGLYDTATTQALEYQSVSIEHAVRADSAFIEIQVGRDTEIIDAQAVIRNQGSDRHRQ